MKDDTADTWRRDEVDSPCKRVCVVLPEAGLCVGCYRTTAEIAEWSRLAPEERRALIEELPGRAARLLRRRGGRAARASRRRGAGR